MVFSFMVISPDYVDSGFVATVSANLPQSSNVSAAVGYGAFMISLRPS